MAFSTRLNFLSLGVIVCLFSAPTFALFEDIETCDEVYSLDLAGFLYSKKINEAYNKAIEPIRKRAQSACFAAGLHGCAAAAAPHNERRDYLIHNRDQELKQLGFRREQLHYHNQHCFE